MSMRENETTEQFIKRIAEQQKKKKVSFGWDPITQKNTFKEEK